MAIGSEITNFCYLENNIFDYVMLVAIESDRKKTATNTGWKNGVICNPELKIFRPSHWFICLLHFNELPFRHLFESVDDDTT